MQVNSLNKQLESNFYKYSEMNRETIRRMLSASEKCDLIVCQ